MILPEPRQAGPRPTPAARAEADPPPRPPGQQGFEIAEHPAPQPNATGHASLEALPILPEPAARSDTDPSQRGIPGLQGVDPAPPADTATPTAAALALSATPAPAVAPVPPATAPAPHLPATAPAATETPGRTARAPAGQSTDPNRSRPDPASVATLAEPSARLSGVAAAAADAAPAPNASVAPPPAPATGHPVPGVTAVAAAPEAPSLAAPEGEPPRPHPPQAAAPYVGIAGSEPEAKPHNLAVRDASQPTWHLALSPHRPASHPAPAPPPEVAIGQVATAIERATGRRVEIRLDPPELGRVQIQLNPIDGGVQALVLAQRPETHELLRRHAEMLLQELADAGFGSVRLDFAAGGDTASHDHPPAADRRPAVAAPAITDIRPGPRHPTADGLDVRL